MVLTVVMTWPIAAGLGRYGRTNTSDGQWSIWVVNWVAHALSTQPTRLYHANIFHPHPDTLAYSEPNIGAGILGLPVWLATRNPFATHNAAVLLGFVWAFVAACGLARYLTGSRVAAAYSAVAFTFCPFVFARSAHIQLLLTAGIPTALLAMHRMVDRPTPGHQNGACYLRNLTNHRYTYFTLHGNCLKITEKANSVKKRLISDDAEDYEKIFHHIAHPYHMHTCLRTGVP